jgi:hypothetical protein
MALTKVTDTLLSSGVGTSANNLVELDSNGKLPAVDGSNLTGLGVFPFAKADGTSDPINLTSNQEVPFTKADGSSDNIALII